MNGIPTYGCKQGLGRLLAINSKAVFIKFTCVNWVFDLNHSRNSSQ